MSQPTKPQRLRIVCKGSHTVPLDRLKVIQGDLKLLDPEEAAKLRRRIETKGFDAPFFVWKNKILDGTQRYQVLQAIAADGWIIPDLPACEIKAKNLKEAKDRILGYISQFGTVTDEGLYEFISTTEGITLEDLNLPNLSIPEFEAGYLQDEPTTPTPQIGTGVVTEEAVERAAEQLERTPGSEKEKVEVTCPDCGEAFMVDKPV